MMLVDDDNIIPYGELVEHFESYTEFDGEDTEGEKEEIEPLQPQKSQHEKFPFYFSDSEELQTTHWGMTEHLPLPELAQKKCNDAITHNYTSYVKLFQLF